MHSFESSRVGADGKREVYRQTFFTLVEMMAANLRSLLAAYEGVVVVAAAGAAAGGFDGYGSNARMKRRYVQAQMELGVMSEIASVF